MKRLLVTLCACTFILTGCMENDKTTILEENVLATEIKYSDKIKKEVLDIPSEENGNFKLGFFYDDKIYGASMWMKEEKDYYIVSEAYRAYYSEKNGFVKEEVDDFTTCTEKRMYIGRESGTNQNNIMRDNATGETVTLPQISITEKEKRDTTTPAIVKKQNGNIDVEVSMRNDSKNRYSDSSCKTVIGNDNYGYIVTTRKSYNDDSVFEKYEFIGDKAMAINVVTNERVLVLYDFANKKSIIQEGEISLDMPKIKEILYSDLNNKMYAIAGDMEDEIYEIEVNGDTFTMNLFYKFDLEGRLTRSYNSKIIDNNLLIETYESDKKSSDKPYYAMNGVNQVLLNLETKELKVLNEEDDNIESSLIYCDSKEYLAVTKVDTKKETLRTFLGRIKDNNIEYLYEFEDNPTVIIVDDKEGRLCTYSATDNGEKYEVYYLDIN